MKGLQWYHPLPMHFKALTEHFPQRKETMSYAFVRGIGTQQGSSWDFKESILELTVGKLGHLPLKAIRKAAVVLKYKHPVCDSSFLHPTKAPHRGPISAGQHPNLSQMVLPLSPMPSLTLTYFWLAFLNSCSAVVWAVRGEWFFLVCEPHILCVQHL